MDENQFTRIPESASMIAWQQMEDSDRFRCEVEYR